MDQIINISRINFSTYSTNIQSLYLITACKYSTRYFRNITPNDVVKYAISQLCPIFLEIVAKYSGKSYQISSTPWKMNNENF